MSALTIAQHGTASSAYTSTLASLPITYAPAREGERPDSVFIGPNRDWVVAAAAAIQKCVKNLVIADPTAVPAASVHELLTLATEHGAAVEFADAYAGDPALELHREVLTATTQTLSALVINETASEVAQETSVLSVLRTVRALGLELAVTSVSSTATGVSIRGTAGELMLSASIARGTTGIGQRVLGLGYGTTLDIALHGSADARPAEIAIASADGERRLPTVYETADRAAWRRIASVPTEGTGALRALLRDLETLERL